MQKNKKRCVLERYIWNPAMCSCKNGRYVESIIGYPAITCDEIIEATERTLTKTVPTKSIPTNFSEKKSDLRAVKFLYFTSLFINYHDIINDCYCLLLLNKISNITEIFINISRC